MRISIESDTLISFEISLDEKQAFLRLHGGEWVLSVSGEVRFIAKGRVEWEEALKRALKKIKET